jgi:hypothetical protein
MYCVSHSPCSILYVATARCLYARAVCEPSPCVRAMRVSLIHSYVVLCCAHGSCTRTAPPAAPPRAPSRASRASSPPRARPRPPPPSPPPSPPPRQPPRPPALRGWAACPAHGPRAPRAVWPPRLARVTRPACDLAQDARHALCASSVAYVRLRAAACSPPRGAVSRAIVPSLALVCSPFSVATVRTFVSGPHPILTTTGGGGGGGGGRGASARARRRRRSRPPAGPCGAGPLTRRGRAAWRVGCVGRWQCRDGLVRGGQMRALSAARAERRRAQRMMAGGCRLGGGGQEQGRRAYL